MVFISAQFRLQLTDPDDRYALTQVQQSRPFHHAGLDWEATSIRTVRGGGAVITARPVTSNPDSPEE